MKRLNAVLFAFMMATLSLAGCFGGDDDGDSDGCPQRMNPLRTIEFYDSNGATLTMAYFETWYSNLDEWGGFPMAGLTFDDSADSAGASAMSFDNTYETMDLRRYEVFC